MKKNILLFIFAIAISVGGFAQPKTQFYNAGSEEFEYVGRIDRSPGESVIYDWPGVQVRFAFTGDKIGIKFNGGPRNYFDLLIDNKHKATLHAQDDTLIWVDNFKGKGKHEAVFFKRTEAGMGKAVFYGVELGKKQTLLSSEKDVTRHIEFIGNSITCGYGNEAANKNEHFKPETENNRKAYCAITARAFGADYSSISHSGLGVVRNYGDSRKVSTKRAPMPKRFARTLDNDSTLLWDFSHYRPQAVVINLGTNDFSTTPHPDKLVFQDAYKRLLDEVREKYNCPVFCLVGPMIDKPCYRYVKEMVEDYAASNPGAVYFIGIPTALLNSAADLGADYHPSYRGQAKMASFLIPVMSNILGWDYDDREIRSLIKPNAK